MAETAFDPEFGVEGRSAPGRDTVHVLPFGRDGGDAGTEAVEVEAGTRGLVLRLLGAGSLSVRILHAASGEQLSGRVKVQSLESGVRRSASGGASSPIEIHGLAGGSHHVIAQAAGGLVGCAREVRVEPGRTQPIDVLVARGGELRVHYSGPHEPAWFELTQDGVRYALENVAPGTSKLAVLPAGRVRARVFAFTGEPGAAGEEPRVLLERELDLAAGELTLLRCEVE